MGIVGIHHIQVEAVLSLAVEAHSWNSSQVLTRRLPLPKRYQPLLALGSLIVGRRFDFREASLQHLGPEGL